MRNESGIPEYAGKQIRPKPGEKRILFPVSKASDTRIEGMRRKICTFEGGVFMQSIPGGIPDIERY